MFIFLFYLSIYYFRIFFFIFNYDKQIYTIIIKLFTIINQLYGVVSNLYTIINKLFINSNFKNEYEVKWKTKYGIFIQKLYGLIL